MGTNTGIGIGIGIPFKNNALGGDRPYLPPELKARLIGVWDNYGKKNTDADRNIIKNKIPNAGGDLEILNAAYKLNSGFGKYKEDFTSWRIYPNIEVTDNVITTNGNFNLTWFIYKHSSESKINEMNIKVSGIPKGGKILYLYISDETANLPIAYTIPKDGIYHLPESKINNNRVSVGFTVESRYDWNNIRIEQIPSFEGAFVTDGVNDLITSTKTVQEMGITDEVTVVSMIHQIDLNSTYTIATTNYIENSNSREHVRSDVYNYGKTGIYGYSASLINNTKSDIKNILGDEADYYVKSTNSLQTIFDAKFSVVGRISELTEASQVAWYWTIIANKVLTTDQINQVIAYFNLDRTLKPDILCDVKKQGITNENHAEFGDKLIDFSGNGRDIQLNNIAWKGDSGIGKYNFSNINIIANRFEGTVTTNKCHFTKKLINTTSNFCDLIVISPNEPIKFKVSGLSDGRKLFVANKSGSGSNYNFDNGEHEVSLSFAEGVGQNNPFGVTGDIGDIDVTVEFIPSHAGALCLDGVNDFGQFVGDLGLKDYTLIMNRAYNNLINNQVPLISSNIVEDQTPFIVEYWNTGSNAISFSYGASRTTDIPLDINKKIVYQSTYSYMGYVIPKGNAISTGNGITLGKFGNGVQYSAICLWSLMLFPYSMSEFLIERQLKKHKLGTLYPNMVEFRPVIKANANYNIFYTALLPLTGIVWEKINIGDYIPVGRRVAIQLSFDNEASELVSAISSQLGNISITKNSNNKGYTIFGDILKNKSPQKINITIDEYIRFEDIIQPYPVLLRFKDENGNEVSWGGKFKVGSTITRIGSFNDCNLLKDIYTVSNAKLNGSPLPSTPHVVERQMVFTCTATWIFDNNEPKCVLSPRLLRVPNSSYKILGYIPDISGHGNHGVIHNSAYAEGSGVNEDGSYQLDGVDDFVTIPTIVGGKQVLMKVNWQNRTGLLYDQRKNGSSIDAFAILNVNSNNSIAYNSRNTDGETYIDGILNKNIVCPQLYKITHSITIINQLANKEEVISPTIGSDTTHKIYFSQMSLYDFMLFDDISTEDKIKELNEYVGIEAKVELPPYYWDTYGKTNLDADKATIQQRGVAVGDYDLTNYNHAYDKMSGYGGYKFAKFDNAIEWFAEDSSMVVNRNGYLITLKKVPNVAFWRFRNTTLKSLDNPLTFKVKCNKPIDVIFQVKFAKNNDVSIGYNYNIKEVTLVPNESTTIIVPSVSVSDIPEATSILFINVLFDNTSLSDNEEYTVEMLPLYPNGLVYDAITDYSENVNIPVFTDFTAIMKRKWLKNQGCPLIKGSKVYEGGNGNALLFEWDKAYNFVFYKRTDIMKGEVPENISFITPTNYNGNVITRGSGQDTNGICIAGDGNAGFANIVFYKLILYPKTIPLLQINFLKNLMERDEIIDLNNPIFIKNE
jgi:hypothetical protein